MSTGPRTRFTIGNTMIVVAALALTLGMVRTPGLAPLLLSSAIAATVGIIALLLGTRRVMELTYGHRCPGCGVRGLERRAILSFGERFFSCPSCGVRCRRNLLGGYGIFFWRDASGPEYDVLYQKPPEDDPWNLPPGLEDEDVAYSKTHLNLVRNKRRRSPENPNGPGLE